MKVLITILGILSSFSSAAFANQIQVAGKIHFADCSRLIVAPSSQSQAGKCVISFSGTSEPSISADGTRSQTLYEGQIAIMGGEMKPNQLVGKNVFLSIDLKKSEVLAWGQRN